MPSVCSTRRSSKRPTTLRPISTAACCSPNWARKMRPRAALKKALATDPTLASAAFNLCVLQMERKDPGGIAYCKQAVKAAPGNEKFVFSLAYYLDQIHQPTEAMALLENYCHLYSGSIDTRLLLADIYLKSRQVSRGPAHLPHRRGNAEPARAAACNDPRQIARLAELPLTLLQERDFRSGPSPACEGSSESAVR